MNYISSVEIAKKWGISKRRVIRLAREGRIKGAKLYGKTWLFPEDAKKPLDGRTRLGKEMKEPAHDNFRFPIFEHKNLSGFLPPLSKNEIKIKKVLELFEACKFKEANKVLGRLPETASDIYISIVSLYIGCMTDIFNCNTKRFFVRYNKLLLLLNGDDFPHKYEMSQFLYELDATLGNNNYYSNQFIVNADCNYHKTFLPRLCNLSALWLAFGEKKIKAEDFNAYEINCRFLETTDSFFDLQALHIYLGCGYAIYGKNDERDYHFKQAFLIAEKYDMFFTFASHYPFMEQEFAPALSDFSDTFKSKLINLCNNTVEHYNEFLKSISTNSIYSMISNNEYIYISFAMQGLTNIEIAHRLNVSRSTVTNRYTEIYNMLKVKNKKQLVELYKNITKM